MPERYYAEKHFIEDISLYLEQMGLPRMAGRILGVLLIANPPEQSIPALCQILRASKSAVSTSTRLLLEMGLIERAPAPLPRQIAFRFKTGGWTAFVRMQLKLMAMLHQVAEQGLEVLRDEPAELRERLQEAHDMFSRIEEEMPALLEHIEKQRGIR